MRLHKHDELVEAMETAMHDCFYGGGEVPEAARAALDALLEAAVRLDAGKALEWDFPCFILRLEASDDK